MRKFSFVLMALFCATALFTACSDDDDDKDSGNGKGEGNGGSGVEVLSNKVSKIVSSHDGVERRTYLFAYDANERLSKITETTNGSTNRVTNITYGDNQITLSVEGQDEPTVIKMKDGRVVSSVEYYGNDYRSEYAYAYSGKYLSKITCKDFTKNNETWKEAGSDESTLTVKDGNLMGIVSTYDYGEEDAGTVTATFEISNTANNANIDLYGFVTEDNVLLLCVAGDRFKKLPAKYTDQEEGEQSDVTTFAYEVNQDGYVTKITQTEDGSYVTVYSVTYE